MSPVAVMHRVALCAAALSLFLPGAPVVAASPFGINGATWSHLGANTPELDWTGGIRRMDALQQMGAAWDRCDFWWHRLEPEPGRFVWTDYDRVVDEYERRGLNLMPILAYDAAWRPQQSPNTDTYREEYGRFVYETVRRYRGRIPAYEIWNEPNGAMYWRKAPSAEDYARLLAVAHREAKRADPNVIVVGGAVAGMDWPFLEGMLRAGAARSMDVLSVHPYQGNLGSVGPEAGALAADLRRLNALLRRYDAGHLRVWITEMGHRTVPDPAVRPGQEQPSGRVSERQQANYLQRSFALAISEGVERVFWFNLWDWTRETWGTVAESGRRKPSWHAYRDMARALDGARFAGREPAPPGVHVLRFERPGDATPTWMAWTERPGQTVAFRAGGTATLQWARRPNSARVPEQRIATAAGQAPVFLNGEPVFLRAATPGGRAAIVTPSATVTAQPASVTPGDTVTLAVRMSDPALSARLAKATRSVALFGPDDRAPIPGALVFVKGTTWRLRGAIAPGTYSIGFRWAGGWMATTPLEVRSALSVTLAPHPVSGRGLRLTVRNHTARTVRATARVDMIGNRVDTVSPIELDPRGSEVLPITNAVPADAPLSVPLPVIASVSSDAGGASWSGNVYFWTAGRTQPGAPLALRSAQEWQSQDGTWTGPEDLSVTITARHDPDYLRLRAEVLDDVFSQPYTLGEVWRGDAFQFAIDPTWGRRPDTSGATEFGLALTPEGPQVYRWTGRGPAGLVDGARLFVRRDGARTVYDAAIPWRELGMAPPRAPRTLGFSFILNDNDGENRQGWLMYGDGIATEKRADRYGTLSLLP